MTKIYTKTGDKGTTSLTGGKRVKKNDLLVEAYGTIDEANSMIGLALAKIEHCSLKDKSSLDKLKLMLIDVQSDLFHVGSEISTPSGEKVYWPLADAHVIRLEANIDQLNDELPALKEFILPGGSEVGATLHLARTIIRRAERKAVSIENEQALSYLNRCSDFLFIAARWINLQLKSIELPLKVNKA